MTFGETGPVPAQGEIAQQIFWYTAFTADVTKPGLLVVNADGTPKWWRMAPQSGGAWHPKVVAHGTGPQRSVLEAGYAERLQGQLSL